MRRDPPGTKLCIHNIPFTDFNSFVLIYVVANVKNVLWALRNIFSHKESMKGKILKQFDKNLYKYPAWQKY